MDVNHPANRGTCNGGNIPEKRSKTNQPYEASAQEAKQEGVHQDSRAWEESGNLVPLDFCEGLSENFDASSGDSELCRRAYKAQKYNKEGKRRHSDGRTREAIKMFKKGAEHGSANANFNLGLCYERGLGVEKDMSKAAVKYAKACEKNHKHAAFNLGMMTINGYCEMHPNEKEGIKYLEKAAQWGLGKAATELGVIAVQQKPSQWNKAFVWFDKAANGTDKDPIGMLFLAHMYHYGHGKCMNTDKATSLYEKAAGIFRQKENKEDPWMLYPLGLCYEYGWGVPINYVEARKCYQKSQLEDSLERWQKLSDTHSSHSSELQEEELGNLMTLVKFKPTVQDGSNVLNDILEWRTNTQEEEDESWGSYSGECGKTTDTESSEESISSSGDVKSAGEHSKVTEKNLQEVSVEFA